MYLHIFNLNVHKCKFKIEERRKAVASLLAQSMRESEIAERLDVHQSTVSKDIKVLKEISQRFVYDLAKSDLAYCSKQCLDGIEEVKRRWDILNEINNLTTRNKLLKLIMECNEAKFALFKEGPAIMQVKSMEERLANIESREINR